MINDDRRLQLAGVEKIDDDENVGPPTRKTRHPQFLLTLLLVLRYFPEDQEDVPDGASYISSSRIIKKQKQLFFGSCSIPDSSVSSCLPSAAV